MRRILLTLLLLGLLGLAEARYAGGYFLILRARGRGFAGLLLRGRLLPLLVLGAREVPRRGPGLGGV